MEKKYVVKLTQEERAELNKVLSNGNAAAKKHKIARVLLGIDVSEEGMGYTDAEIIDKVEVSAKTVARLRQKFVEGGLEKVFQKKFTPRLSRRKFQGEEEARLIALCCSEAPEGYARWSLRLLSNRVVEYKILESVSYETIRQTLKKTNLNRG
jgi:transposase